MFTKILIANRGEIACRIIDTAKRLGIETVAVYSDADKNARHVRLADFSEHIGPAPSQQSYLNIEAIIAAAKKHQAEAIHPGYGFLSENPSLSKACAENNLVFIGPNADAMITMADKSLAKETMQKADVPVVPGFYSDDKNIDWEKEANKIGYPLLIKAVAGGGGRGMRLVESAKDFNDAFVAAQREAKAYFDDDRVFLEKYLTNPRHIEIQVFADQHGNCVYLFERDCSIQRRHQKIVEEAPAPNFSEKLREKMGETAVRAAQAINYVGAGTIEFLLDDDGQFYFMEMNTRLQVEHPVTEMITGLDLVEWQLLVANNNPLPLTQDKLSINGHAIEVRIYAEDPSKNFMPSVGELAHISFAIKDQVRLDTGYDSGDKVSMHYDAMIAKLIVYAKNRDEACDLMYQALCQAEIIGVATNIEMLKNIIKSSDFRDAKLSTHFLQKNEALMSAQKIDVTTDDLLAAAFALREQQRAENFLYFEFTNDDYSPWSDFSGWRMNTNARQNILLWHNDTPIKIYCVGDVFYYDDNEFAVAGAYQDDSLKISINQQAISARVIFWHNQCHLYRDDAHHVFYVGHSKAQDTRENAGSGQVVAPMPGTVVDVFVKNGSTVNLGDKLLIIEAMKMEHTMTAHSEGTIENLTLKAGDSVNEGMELLSIK